MARLPPLWILASESLAVEPYMVCRRSRMFCNPTPRTGPAPSNTGCPALSQQADPVILDTEQNRIALALRLHQDSALTHLWRHAVSDRILDQRLQNQGGYRGLRDRSLHLKLNLQPLSKSDLFNVQIGTQKSHLLIH